MSNAPGQMPSMRVKVRNDLIVTRQKYEGLTHFVVKDPVGMRYFRFKEEEYYLVQRFDGVRTLEEIKEVNALMTAAYMGHHTMIPFLLSIGIDIDALTVNGGTALMGAAQQGNVDSVRAGPCSSCGLLLLSNVVQLPGGESSRDLLFVARWIL